MAHPQTFFDINYRSPAEELLAMIERRAPILLRAGGCALSNERVGRLSEEARARIAQLASEGHGIAAIVRVTGYPRSTVADHIKRRVGATHI